MIPLQKSIQSGMTLLVILASFVFTQDMEAARGRPYINADKTTFVADNGNLLRGAQTSTELGSVPTAATLQAIKSYGCNAVHCYAERSDYGYAAGAQAAALDSLVQLTADNGLYLIITVGGGGANSTFNAAFWNYYAARYASKTHVIYEIQNEPTSGAPCSSTVITMEKAAYKIIRANAPNTPVLFFTYMTFNSSSGVLQDIASLGSDVDWSNAAIAFHGYGTGGPLGCLGVLDAVLNAGYPCFQTEFYDWPWGTGNFALGASGSLYQDQSETGGFERYGVSWLTFLPLSKVTDDTRFKNIINNAGIVWTPDYGTWPSGSRSTYGNNGEPWTTGNMSATLRIEAENFDTGGQGVAYNDLTTANSGGKYRTSEGVDIQTTSDTDGTYNIGYISSGEWLEYTAYVKSAALYNLKVRVASPNTTNTLSVSFAGVNATGSWTFSGTGGYQTWTTISKTVTLTPGQQVIRLTALSSNFNLNWIELTPVTTGLITAGTYKFINRNSSKAMDVVDASTANGAKIQQWSYAGNINQKWVLTHLGGNQFSIASAQTGKGVDEASYTSLSGDYIEMWDLSSGVGSNNQRWLISPTDSGYYKIINVNSGLALGITDASTANGAIVEQREYSGATNQQWLIATP